MVTKLSFKKLSNNPMNLEMLLTNTFFKCGLLIERAHYYANLAEKGCPIR